MLKNVCRVFTSLSCILLFACSSQPTVSSIAMEDQAIGATYTGLVQQLGAAWKAGAREQFSSNTNLSNDDITILLRHIDRYPADDFRVQWVLVRYPHYGADALRQDYARLLELGIVETAGDDRWRITEYGIEVYNEWRAVLSERAERFDAQYQGFTADVLTVLDKVMASSALLDDGHINKSVLWRTNHQFRWPAEAPALLRIDERMGDQIAFQNDNAHYRIDIYASAFEVDPALLVLSPLAHELYGATCRAEGYPIARCYNQSHWRVTEEACDTAMAELIAANVVVEIEAKKFAHSLYGAGLFQEIESFVDTRRYSVWSDVTHAEYARYKAILANMPTQVHEAND